MKTTDKRKLFTTAAAVLLFALAITAAVISGFALAPKLISYTVSTRDVISDDITSTQKCLYNDYSEIIGDGPFEIRCEEKSIYIFKDGVRLYCIKAPLDRLTGSDISRMKEGIVIETYPELYELIQHIES